MALGVLVYTPAEFEELQRTRFFVRLAAREGRVIYEAAAEDAALARARAVLEAVQQRIDGGG